MQNTILCIFTYVYARTQTHTQLPRKCRITQTAKASVPCRPPRSVAVSSMPRQLSPSLEAPGRPNRCFPVDLPRAAIWKSQLPRRLPGDLVSARPSLRLDRGEEQVTCWVELATLLAPSPAYSAACAECLLCARHPARCWVSIQPQALPTRTKSSGKGMR